VNTQTSFDPKLDLEFTRTTQLTPAQIWEAWTNPTTLMKWFCPRPWKVTDCRIDLRPGGEFFTVMEGPSGERMENHGCFLEISKNEKLVWTNLMKKDYRPVLEDKKMGFHFVATILISRSGDRTNYRAVVAHADEVGKKKHEQMGFQEGWGMAFNQMTEFFGAGSS
jgi:uncharacterized protein YndB with AHSA1/START domain